MKKSKSRKYAAWLALRAAGQTGLTLQQVVDASRELHPEWTPQEQANLRTVRDQCQGFASWDARPGPACCCLGFRTLGQIPAETGHPALRVQSN